MRYFVGLFVCGWFNFYKKLCKYVWRTQEGKTQEFEMIDIELMSYYLGIKVKQLEEYIFISQERYAWEII